MSTVKGCHHKTVRFVLVTISKIGVGQVGLVDGETFHFDIFDLNFLFSVSH